MAFSFRVGSVRVKVQPTWFSTGGYISGYIPPPSPPRDNPLLAPTITDLTAILAILRSVDTAATLVCNEIDNALEPEHEERQALKDLRKGLEGAS